MKTRYAECAHVSKGVDVKERSITHLVSTAAVDRAGDVVDPAGWDFANYLRNPVVLIDHDYSIKSVVGRAVSLTVDETGVWAKTKFADTPLARDAFSLVQGGFVKGWSVGFSPSKYKPIKDRSGTVTGIHYKAQELLEYSLVSIPMNPEAVSMALAKGIDEQHIPILFSEDQPADAARDGANADPEEQSEHPVAQAFREVMRQRELERLADRLRRGA